MRWIRRLRRLDPHPLRPWTVGLAVFTALVPFVHGDVTWFDAGELSAAEATLGVPHPTGFPLLCLLGHAASLLPIGPLPFRLALVSAGCLALATALVFAAALRNGARPWPALSGALLLPSVTTVWIHGTEVEVYALSGLVVAALLHLLARPRPALLPAAFVLGLAASVHAAAVLVGGLVFLAVLVRERPLRVLPAAVGFGAVGLLALAYLPVAAAREPWISWGDPKTPEAFFAHVTGAGIRSSFAGEIGSASGLGPALAAWSENAGGSPFHLWIAALAAAVFAVRTGYSLVLGIAAVAGDAFFSAVLNPMGQAELQTGFPGAVGLAFAFALAAGAPAPRSRRAAAVLAALAAVAAAASDRPERRVRDEAAGAYGRLAFSEASPGAVLLASSDHLASLAYHLQGSEGLRRDVAVVVKQHLPDGAATAAALRRGGHEVPPSFLAVPANDPARRLSTLVRELLPRAPVLWEMGDGRFDPSVAPLLVPGALLHRVATSPDEAERDGGLPPPDLSIAEALAGGRQLGSRSRRVLSDALRFRGVLHLLRDETRLAGPPLRLAVSLDPENPPALLNLAAVLRREGRLADAIGLLESAVALSPRYRKAWENLASYRRDLGDAAGASEAEARLRDL